MSKKCRLRVSSERRCGKAATYKLDEGTHRGSPLCAKHARLQKSYGYRVVKL